ncbi:biogenesis of lysosome- organelles complex 1 subunit 1 [Nowakowskiella sp. JEL0407]|nr:biogenesis of lysosome- organelles complex 1 subunit 1 [Nowakowskiella sp. JEL0407]
MAPKASAHFSAASESVSKDFQSGVSDVYKNQISIEANVKALQISLSTFAKQQKLWLDLVDNFNTALKELGDVENWSELIERDFEIVAKTVAHIQEESSM